MAATTQSVQELRDLLRAQMEVDSTGGSVIPRKVIFSAKTLPAELLSGKAKDWALKINSLTNLYYFSTVILGKNRFQTSSDPVKNQSNVRNALKPGDRS